MSKSINVFLGGMGNLVTTIEIHTDRERVKQVKKKICEKLEYKVCNVVLMFATKDILYPATMAHEDEIVGAIYHAGRFLRAFSEFHIVAYHNNIVVG